jgi:transportin-1
MEYRCQYLRNIRDNSEKESAFQGVCRIVAQNPNQVIPYLVYLIDAIVQWHQPPDSLNESFRKVLTLFKQGMGNEWERTLATFPTLIKERLKERYGL